MRAGPNTGRLGHVRATATQPRQARDVARGGGPAAWLPEPGIAVPGDAAGGGAVRGAHPPGPLSAWARPTEAGLSCPVRNADSRALFPTY